MCDSGPHFLSCSERDPTDARMLLFTSMDVYTVRTSVNAIKPVINYEEKIQAYASYLPTHYQCYNPLRKILWKIRKKFLNITGGNDKSLVFSKLAELCPMAVRYSKTSQNMLPSSILMKVSYRL